MNTKITMRLVRTLTKIEQQLQLQTHVEYSYNEETGKENPEKVKKVLRDAKLLERLGSGLDRKTLRALKDFRMFQLFSH